MKQVTFFLILTIAPFWCASFLTGFSQEKTDTTIINVGKKRIIIVERKNTSQIDEPDVADSPPDTTAYLDEPTSSSKRKRYRKEIDINIENDAVSPPGSPRDGQFYGNFYGELIEKLRKIYDELEQQIRQTEDAITKEALREVQEDIHEQMDELREEAEERHERFNTPPRRHGGHPHGHKPRHPDTFYEPHHHNKTDLTFGGFSLGLNNLLINGSFDYPASYQNLELRTGKSIHVRLAPIGVHFPLGNRFNIQSDISFDWNNYRFLNDVSLKSNSNYLTVIVDSISLTKNKLVTTWLGVPVMFGWESPKIRHSNNRLRVGLGWYTGYLLSAYTKQVSKEQGTVKNRENFGINRVAYGPKVRIGYGFLNLYAQYMLSHFLLKEPSNNINFGIEFVGF